MSDIGWIRRRWHLCGAQHTGVAQVRTRTYDFRAFCGGALVETPPRLSQRAKAASVALGGALGALAPQVALASPTHPVSLDHAFDPVITMIEQMAFPVASIVLAWACLEAMIGRPAQAVSRAKWAVIGYLAIRYAPGILRQI